jgi:deoxycytidylate deaminase
MSNCKKSKYGCIVLKDSRLVADGCNRVLKCHGDWNEPECIRKNIQARTESMIGCCGHAEEFALSSVICLGIPLYDLDFFVAGIRSNGEINIIPERRFTCLRCATQLYMHNVKAIHVPVIDHWESLTTNEAIQSAKQYALGKERSHE